MSQSLASIRFRIQNRLRDLRNSKLPYVKYPRYAFDRRYYLNQDIYHEYLDTDLFCNLGAGHWFFHPRWHCFDFYSREFSRKSANYINWDFREKKPLPASYLLAYCSHVIEHIPACDADAFISIVFASLREGGAFRLVLPDADLVYDAYISGRLSFFEIFSSRIGDHVDPEHILEFFLCHLIATCKSRAPVFTKQFAIEVRSKSLCLDKHKFLDWLTSDIFSNIDSGMDHVTWYNYSKLEDLLKRNGFSHVYRSGFGQSCFTPMRQFPLFDGWLPSISMYVECIKD